MDKSKPLLTVEAVLAHINFIRNKRQEYCLCLSLDSGRRLIARRTVTIGLLNASLVHPREVFAGPIKDRAASVIIVHNHPSGEAAPSDRDIEVTQQLVAAGILLGIRVADHVIVSKNDHYSFKAHSLI